MSREIIQRYKILAKKSLGQNFLIDEDILESIAGIIDVSWIYPTISLLLYSGISYMI